MVGLKDKVAHLQGLADGIKLDRESKEGKVLSEVIAVLGDLAESVDELHHAQLEIEDYLEDVDEDLSVLENEIFGDQDEETVEIKCPNCGQILYLESGETDDQPVDLICPNCGEVVYATEGEYDFPNDGENLDGSRHRHH